MGNNEIGANKGTEAGPSARGGGGDDEDEEKETTSTAEEQKFDQFEGMTRASLRTPSMTRTTKRQTRFGHRRRSAWTLGGRSAVKRD